MNKKERRLRIGWSSNAPWGTSGYATQSNLIVSRLAAAGFPIGFNAFAGLICGYFNTNNSDFNFKGKWENVAFYPTNRHVYGSDGLWINLQNHFNADIVIPFQDIFTLHPEDLSKVKRFVPYVPIDRDPVPPPVLAALNSAWRIISYSQWGHNQLLRHGYVSECIPHGVDVDVYKPLNKSEEKMRLGIDPNTFVFGMVAANKEWPPRKGFQHALDAFNEFQKKVPNSLFWFHVDVHRQGGFEIAQYANFLGIGHKIKFLPEYEMEFFQPEDMNHLYNAFDVLLMPSFSEGFGIPAVEAQAAGVPVIVNGFSALTELVKHEETGYVCKPGYQRFDPQGAYHREIDLQDLIKGIEYVYSSNRTIMGQNARQWVIDNYDINKIVESKWIPFLEKIEETIYGPIPQKKEEPTLSDAVEQSLSGIAAKYGESSVKFF